MRAVIDTNVLFEGLTKQGGACGLIVDAWRAGKIEACVTNALAFEYEDVLCRGADDLARVLSFSYAEVIAMNNVTLTLPDTIYRQLVLLAQNENLSLSQYLLNAMTAHAVANYRVRATSEPERLQQRAEFLALLDRLGTASEEEIDRALAEREPIEPEPELDAETISKFRALIEESASVKHTG
jgi:hypothetical protein